MAVSNNISFVNSGVSLDVMATPGQNIRFPLTSSDSVLTFGDFILQTNISTNNLETTNVASGYTTFATLQSLSSDTFNAFSVITATTNELNLKYSDPQSYAYYGSFYTKVATAINNVIATYPYAILATSTLSSNTIFNYLNEPITNTSSFNIPLSGLTNQDNIPLISGTSSNANVTTLYDNFNQFAIQLSATTTAQTQVFTILSYSYQSGPSGFMTFVLEGFLFADNTTTASTIPVYIRPSLQTLGQYNNTLSNLENQLLYVGEFMAPDSDDTFSIQTFIWPTTIDGFSPDSYGPAFEAYSKNLLNTCSEIDTLKTNWMTRTLVSPNFIALDTDTQIFQNLIAVYSQEFDQYKQYIDSLAYMHTVRYDGQNSIPEKFLSKLSGLLGLKFSNAFNNTSVFDYLGAEIDSSGQNYKEYNNQLWQKLLININWLFKKKGTRASLQFIFDLIGAPPNLVNFDEFVYQVNQYAFSGSTSQSVINASTPLSQKIDQFGYINFAASQFVFQESDNGMAYVDQWLPEFSLQKIVDNVKIYTGNTLYNGTENLFNTKELNANINPAYAIETDVKEWYDLGFGIWNWGSSGITFTGLTVPFEWTVEEFEVFVPDFTSGMTISQWLDYIYMNVVDPRNRKVYGSEQGHVANYNNLRRIYMTYLLWDNNQISNRLTFQRLEAFVELLERNFQEYVPQLIPATTILDFAGTMYRNTLFDRHKFVYPKGINDGSEFQIALPPVVEPSIIPNIISTQINNIIEPKIVTVSISTDVNDIIEPPIKTVQFSADINNIVEPKIQAAQISGQVVNTIGPNIISIQISSEINQQVVENQITKNIFYGTIINALDNPLVSYDNS